MTTPIRTLLDIEDVLDMCCFIDRLFYRCMDMCEYDTPDADDTIGPTFRMFGAIISGSRIDEFD